VRVRDRQRFCKFSSNDPETREICGLRLCKTPWCSVSVHGIGRTPPESRVLVAEKSGRRAIIWRSGSQIVRASGGHGRQPRSDSAPRAFDCGVRDDAVISASSTCSRLGPGERARSAKGVGHARSAIVRSGCCSTSLSAPRSSCSVPIPPRLFHQPSRLGPTCQVPALLYLTPHPHRSAASPLSRRLDSGCRRGSTSSPRSQARASALGGALAGFRVTPGVRAAPFLRHPGDRHDDRAKSLVWPSFDFSAALATSPYGGIMAAGAAFLVRAEPGRCVHRVRPTFHASSGAHARHYTTTCFLTQSSSRIRARR